MDLPLFPLHVVLCPGVALPLHIFEARYRELVGRCLADGTPFGVVLIREGRETSTSALALASVGTVAEIREANRYPDGRFDLLTVGTRRFAIEEVRVGPEPYLVGRVATLPETLGDPARAKVLATRVSRRFIRYLELVRPADGEDGEELDIQVEVDVPGGSDPDAASASVAAPTDEAGSTVGIELPGSDAHVRIPDDPTTLSHLMSGIIQVELPRRQALLEADTAEARLTDIDRLLDRELDLLGRRLRAWNPDRGMLAGRRN